MGEAIHVRAGVREVSCLIVLKEMQENLTKKWPFLAKSAKILNRVLVKGSCLQEIVLVWSDIMFNIGHTYTILSICIKVIRFCLQRNRGRERRLGSKTR